MWSIKEVSQYDGFIITAFIARKYNSKDDNMVTRVLEEQDIDYLLKAVTNLIKLPGTKMWLDYDADVDVLYLHCEEKPASTHSEMREDGIILDYKDDMLVGLTVLEASQR